MSRKSIEYLVSPLRDEDNKRYVPYCDLGWHQGIIKVSDYKECERRRCDHYRRLYIAPDKTTRYSR